MKKIILILLLVGLWASSTFSGGMIIAGLSCTTPTLTSITIDSTGTTATELWSANVQQDSATLTLNMSGGASAASYSSGGGGTSTSIVYSLARTILSGETSSTAAIGSGVTDSTGGCAVGALSGKTVTNNSTHTGNTPTLTSATVDATGRTITLVFSESCTAGTGGSAGWSATFSTQGATTMTYVSGSPGTSWVYNLNKAVVAGETGTVAYTQPNDGVQATTGGCDVASIASAAVTNNSTAYNLSAYASLVLWYNFENNKNDGSANGNTLGNQTTYPPVNDTSFVKNGSYNAGKFDSTHYGFSLLNSSATGNIPGKTGITTTSMTVGGWIKGEDVASLKILFADGVAGTAWSWCLYSFGGLMRFQIADAAGTTKYIASGASSIANEDEVFIVGTWDGSYLNLYMKRNTGAFGSAATHVACSALYNGFTTPSIYVSDPTWFWVGYLDDLAVFYNQVLTTDEMTSWYTHGLNNSH